MPPYVSSRLYRPSLGNSFENNSKKIYLFIVSSFAKRLAFKSSYLPSIKLPFLLYSFSKIQYENIRDDLLCLKGLWAYDAGDFWRLMDDMLLYYNNKSEQGDVSITHHLLYYCEHAHFARIRHHVQQERILYVTRKNKAKSVRFKRLELIEETSYRHFQSTLKWVYSQVQKRL